MKVPFARVEDVLKTLPIGYYFGAKADVKLVNGPNTYCAPDRNEICISYPTIAGLLKDLKTDDPHQLEKDIRCLLYHEVSHLILTPKALLHTPSLQSYHFSDPIIYAAYLKSSSYDSVRKTVENIVEDQRIETMLQDYFFDVDFKEFNIRLNAGMPETPRTAEDLLFMAVILRKGPAELVEAADALINKSSAFVSMNAGDVCRYCADIFALWHKAVKLFEGASDKKKEDFPTKKKEGSSAKKKEDAPARPAPVSNNTLKHSLFEQVEKRLTDGLDMSTSAAIDKIIKKAISKKGVTGSSSIGYSGLVDPRSTGNRDYRWFVKPTGDSSGKFSKVKLNLFIDVSGSFVDSQRIINNVIRGLIAAENNYHDFSFDVVKMGHCCYQKNEIGTMASNYVAPKDKRYVSCFGGNLFDKTIVPCFKAVQDPTARNYNIVVFDGDAWSDSRNKSEDQRYIKVFNNPATTIISDVSNKPQIETRCKLSKNIFVKSNYAGLLKDNVLRTLETALA